MYRQHEKLLAAIIIALAATFSTVAAQTTVRGVIGSGGTSSSNGTITAKATLGQAAIGPTGSSAKALQGFWYTLTPPPPAAVPGDNNATASAAMQCSPNPVSAQAELRVRIDHTGPVTLRLFDAIGREVATLADGVHEAGTISVTLDAARLAAGTYVAQLVTDNDRQIIRIAVVK